MAEATKVMRVGDVVGVRPHPTVVRLDDLARPESGWISESYCITDDVRRHLDALGSVFSRPSGTGVFVIGQYGSGKSHLLAYVTRQLESLAQRPLEAVPVSLLNYRAELALEHIVGEALGLDPVVADRRASWSGRFGDGARGVVLILDELSEFLRSKPDARRFNEDIRFLQFMGEWAQGHPFWPLAAVQEQIEHMGDLEHGSYRKIKDRYPIRLLLTPAHVRDLIGRGILLKKEAYADAVEKLAARLAEAFPWSPVGAADLRALYPVHPATLDVLEEVRDRFSQARGVVDFTVTQLAGDPARGATPFLDRPFGSLLCPDAIVDHFRDLFEVQPEFLALAQQVLPHYRKHLAELFPAPARRELAERVLKLLILAYLSPSREGLTARDAAGWLLTRGTRLDPDKNLEIMEAILQTFAREGRFVAHGADRYRLDLADDGGSALERALEREMAELAGRGEEVFEIVAPLLGEEGLNPLALPREQWQSRTVRWHFHDRPYAVHLGGGEPTARRGISLCIRLPWGEAGAVPGAFTVVPGRMEIADEHLELAALVRVRDRSLVPDAARRVQARIDDRLELLRSQLRDAYLEADLTNPMGAVETLPRFERSTTTRAWLDRLAEKMLQHVYPAFEKFSPVHGPLPKEAYRRFMRFVTEHDLGDFDADDHVQVVREGYLVPMGLLARKGRGYAPPSRPERNELVRLVLPLIEHEPSPKVVYEHLANPVYGLVPDQVGVLLAFLNALGVLELRKGGRTYRECFDLLPDPIQYDKVLPGRGLSAEQIRSLEQLCTAVGVAVPKGWTVPEQRRTVEQLRNVARAEIDRLGAFGLKIEDLQQEGELAEDVRRMRSRWGALLKGDDSLEGFEQFLYELESVSAFGAMHDTLSKLPQRIDRLMGEARRFKHLFGKTLMEHCLDMDLVLRIQALGEAPRLDRPDELEQWLGRARELHEKYKADYTRRHEAWWRSAGKHAIWHWQPPAIARSRHVGLGSTLAELAECRQRAAKARCRGLVNLDFQPVCTCGFDGGTAPLQGELKRFEDLQSRIDKALRLFFRQDSVRARLREWSSGGLESPPGMEAYLEGRADVPDIENVELLDQHLSGVELVKEIGIEPVVKLLGERVWERGALVKAFEQLLARHGAERLRFGVPDATGSPLAAWCAEQAARHGLTLPEGLSAGELAEVAGALRPEWFGGEALGRLDDLRLPEGAAERVAGWIVERRIATGSAAGSSSPLVGAALEVLDPSTPGSPRALAALSARLYGQHARMMRVAGERWLERIGRLAETPVTGIGALVDALRRHEDAQWLVIDAMGLPLLPVLEESLPALYDRRLESLEFATVSSETTTSRCYDDMVRAGLARGIEKINAVDTMLHERFLPFDDLCRFATAELHLACKNKAVDPARPLLIFADHGFRIAPDGRSYTHGGASTLERVVPVMRLARR